LDKRASKKYATMLGGALAITLCFSALTSALYFDLQNRFQDLKVEYEQIKAIVESTREYFFFQDGEFLDDGSWLLYNYSVPDASNVVETFQKYTNQCAHGFYNTTDGEGDWAGAQFLQGQLPHEWRRGGSILGGSSLESSKPVEGVTFYRDLPLLANRFFFNAKVKVLRRNYTTFGADEYAWANIAPQFTFVYDDKNYDDPNKWNPVAINVEVILSQAKWDRETQTQIHTDESTWTFNSPWDGDYRICIVLGKITELNRWYTFKIDMKSIIDAIFKYTPAEEIAFKAIIIGNDGSSSYSEAMYEYAYMSLDP